MTYVHIQVFHTFHTFFFASLSLFECISFRWLSLTLSLSFTLSPCLSPAFRVHTLAFGLFRTESRCSNRALHVSPSFPSKKAVAVRQGRDFSSYANFARPLSLSLSWDLFVTHRTASISLSGLAEARATRLCRRWNNEVERRERGTERERVRDGFERLSVDELDVAASVLVIARANAEVPGDEPLPHQS